uniref:Uncharacterized protein n=2 Tax=Klebsiella TaxID=570 RepID=A0A345WXJ3_KLEOX|nr:hypothetical protein [Klebsiella oxytoca]AXJ98744.1 hypothetical protein [Klebsiella pneumoniae]UGK55376.1 Hypothetical protein [Raoultella ornithinolytica]UUW42167.1 hypothetical protein [Klebsiella michiganensis]
MILARLIVIESTGSVCCFMAKKRNIVIGEKRRFYVIDASFY